MTYNWEIRKTMKRRYSMSIALCIIFLGYLSSYLYATFLQCERCTLGINPLFYYFFWVPTFYFLMLFVLGKTIFGPFKDIFIYVSIGLLSILYNVIIHEKPFLNDVLFLISGTLFLSGIIAIVFKKKSKNQI